MRMMAVAAALLLASCNETAPAPDIKVEGVWARATLPGQAASAAYFTIVNDGGADALLSVTSPVAAASLHSTSMANGVMKMRPVASVDVPASGRVNLKPGGIHVMVTGLKQPLPAGSRLPLDLNFQKSAERHVEAEVKPAGAAGAGM